MLFVKVKGVILPGTLGFVLTSVLIVAPSPAWFDARQRTVYSVYFWRPVDIVTVLVVLCAAPTQSASPVVHTNKVAACELDARVSVTTIVFCDVTVANKLRLGVQIAEPSELVAGAGQGEQETVPLSFANVFVAHGAHVDEADVEYQPSAHSWQTFPLPAAICAEKRPATQGWHTLAPFAAAYRPVPHGEHVELLFAAIVIE